MKPVNPHFLLCAQKMNAQIAIAVAVKREANNEASARARQAAVERDVVGSSIKLAPRRGRRDAIPNFAAPAKRKALYLSSTGQRAFHLGFSSVTKSSAPRKQWTRSYKGAAAKHVSYIEDGAHGVDRHTAYIDGSRVETRHDGERLVVSNISDQYAERVEFFHLVEQFERDNRGDSVQIDFGFNATQWEFVTKDPDCDPAVIAAFKNRLAKRCPRIPLQGSGAELRSVMSRHGFEFWYPMSNTERLFRDGFCFHEGRAGRTEYRLVFELPREFNQMQRMAALNSLSHRFEKLGCMYVGVIHAPDPHNDADNYHIHLDFYDRKCRRLDGTDNDLVNVKPQFLDAIKAEIATGRYCDDVRARAWDFTVQRTYVSNKCKKTHRPFRAPQKSAEVRHKHFVRKIRQAFAEDVNAIASNADLGALYDPRRYAEMGISAPATAKLGQKKSAMEKKGTPTQTGIDNETLQAAFQIHLIEQEHQNRCNQIAQLELHWQQIAPPLIGNGEHGRRLVEEELAAAKQAGEVRRNLDLLAVERERERSRATLVSECQKRAAKAGRKFSNKGSVPLAEAADRYLASLDARDVALMATVSELERFAAAHGPDTAKVALNEFERELAHNEVDRTRTGQAVLSSPPRRSIITKRGQLNREVAPAEQAKATGPDFTPANTGSPESGTSSAPPRRSIITKRCQLNSGVAPVEQAKATGSDFTPANAGSPESGTSPAPPRRSIITKRGQLNSGVAPAEQAMATGPKPKPGNAGPTELELRKTGAARSNMATQNPACLATSAAYCVAGSSGAPSIASSQKFAVRNSSLGLEASHPGDRIAQDATPPALSCPLRSAVSRDSFERASGAAPLVPPTAASQGLQESSGPQILIPVAEDRFFVRQDRENSLQTRDPRSFHAEEAAVPPTRDVNAAAAEMTTPNFNANNADRQETLSVQYGVVARQSHQVEVSLVAPSQGGIDDASTFTETADGPASAEGILGSPLATELPSHAGPLPRSLEHLASQTCSDAKEDRTTARGLETITRAASIFPMQVEDANAGQLWDIMGGCASDDAPAKSPSPPTRTEPAEAERVCAPLIEVPSISRSAATEVERNASTRSSLNQHEEAGPSEIDLRMKGSKENTPRSASAAAPAIDGEALRRHIEDKRIYLVLNEQGLVEPHDPAILSEDERTWLKYNLSGHGIRLEQEREIDRVAEYFKAHIDEFVKEQLKLDQDSYATWIAYAAAPQMQDVFKAAEQYRRARLPSMVAVDLQSEQETARESEVSPATRDIGANLQGRTVGPQGIQQGQPPAQEGPGTPVPQRSGESPAEPVANVQARLAHRQAAAAAAMAARGLG
ncbi:MAG: hypothetical protein DI591_11120 [Citromicrobium sp.]|nr:MAG: hypothetical protein DI591_11120 [Citromicrobium sp.]